MTQEERELKNIVSGLMCITFTHDMQCIQEHYIAIFNGITKMISNLNLTIEVKELEDVLTSCIANAINQSFIKNLIEVEDNDD